MPLFSTKQFSSRIITIYSQLHQPFSKTINLKTNHKLKLLHIRPIYHFKLRICWYVCRLIECTLISEKYIYQYLGFHGIIEVYPSIYRICSNMSLGTSYISIELVRKLTTKNYSVSTELSKHLGN